MAHKKAKIVITINSKKDSILNNFTTFFPLTYNKWLRTNPVNETLLFLLLYQNTKSLFTGIKILLLKYHVHEYVFIKWSFILKLSWNQDSDAITSKLQEHGPRFKVNQLWHFKNHFLLIQFTRFVKDFFIIFYFHFFKQYLVCVLSHTQ